MTEAPRKAVGRWLVAAALVAVVLRLAYCFLLNSYMLSRYPLWALDDRYDEIAVNLVEHGRYAMTDYSTTERLPAYPYFLVPMFAAFGPRPEPVWLAQTALSVATLLLLFALGRRTFGPTVAVIAAFLFAVYPHSILHVPRYATETLYVFLLVAFAYAFQRSCDESSLRWPILAGVACGASLLTKSTLALFPVGVVLVLLLSRVHRQHAGRLVRDSAIIVVISAVMLAPWIWRNALLTGKFIPLATLGARVSYAGYHVTDHYFDGRPRAEVDTEGLNRADDIAAAQRHTWRNDLDSPWNALDEYYGNRAIAGAYRDRVFAQPLRSLGLFLRGQVFVWFSTLGTMTTLLAMVYQVPLLALGLINLVLLGRSRRAFLVRLLPLVWLVAYFNVTMGVIYPHVRFIMPVVPVVMLFAADTLRLLYETLARRAVPTPVATA